MVVIAALRVHTILELKTIKGVTSKMDQNEVTRNILQ
jgi:hypothetical protein